MITCVEKRNKLREEFDRLVESHNIDELSSPEIVEEAIRLERLLNRIK